MYAPWPHTAERSIGHRHADKNNDRMIAVLRAAFGTSSGAGCTNALAQRPRNSRLARSVSAPVFDVLDECAQLGQNLTSAWVV